MPVPRQQPQQSSAKFDTSYITSAGGSEYTQSTTDRERDAFSCDTATLSYLLLQHQR